MEVRKVDGSHYPPNTMCCGLDACIKELKSTGKFGVRQAAPISEDVEEVLWQKDVLGESCPQTLVESSVLSGLMFHFTQ